jgi:hypothetical protein
MAEPTQPLFVSPRHTIASLPVSRAGERGERVWLQGVVVRIEREGEAETSFWMDDGTGVVKVQLETLASKTHITGCGTYCLVVGNPVFDGTQGCMQIEAHSLVDLDEDPDSEAVWMLEVTDSAMRAVDKAGTRGS